MKEKSLKLMNDSIKAIRDFCSDLDIDCTEEYCPFAHIANGYVKCKLDEEPTNWNINDEKDEIWRALK